MEKPKKKTGAFLAGIIKNATSSGTELNVNNAPIIASKKTKTRGLKAKKVMVDEIKDFEPETEPIQKVSMDLKMSTVYDIHSAMYWGRMDSRAEVVETALAEYFKNHPELIKPIPQNKKK